MENADSEMCSEQLPEVSNYLCWRSQKKSEPVSLREKKSTHFSVPWNTPLMKFNINSQLDSRFLCYNWNT